MASLNLENVGKNYNPKELEDTLKSINISIKDGEFIVFVGPSGCGKSTLLRMIAGLEDITYGELFINQKLMNNVASAKRNVGMVFQSYALYPHMNLFDNMAFGLKLKKMPKQEIEKRVKQSSSILGLDPLLYRKPKDLSGGQRQRVAIGRCIVQQPQVFLFDEPLSNLDAALRVKMRIEIAKLHKKLNATIIYVTHDQVEAMTLADKIVVLSPYEKSKKTNLEQFGSPLELYENPANKFVAGFIGSPKMNFLKGSISNIINNQPIITLDAGFDVSALVDAKDIKENDIVEFGIRPEHVSLFDQEVSDFYLEGTLVVKEHLGAESFVYMQIGQDDFSFKTTKEITAKAGDKIKVSFTLEKTYLFDKNGFAFKRVSKNKMQS